MTFQETTVRDAETNATQVGPEARAHLQALVEPQALAITAGVLTAWVVSHAFGIGEINDINDIIVAAIGVAAIGWSVFVGLDHLYEFAAGV